jgi:hypothetical protein
MNGISHKEFPKFVYGTKTDGCVDMEKTIKNSAG